MLGLGRSIRKEEILLPSLWRPPAAFQTKASECACFRSYASPESKAWVASHWHTLWFYVLLFMRNKTKKTILAVRQTLNHQIHRRTEEKFPASHSLCAVICCVWGVHMCICVGCTHVHMGVKGRDNLCCCVSGAIHLCLRQSLTVLAQEAKVAGQPQWSSCLGFSRTWVRSVYQNNWLFTWVLWIELQVFVFARVCYLPSHLLSFCPS